MTAILDFGEVICKTTDMNFSMVNFGVLLMNSAIIRLALSVVNDAGLGCRLVKDHLY